MRAWFERQHFELIICDSLLAEVARVLGEDRMRRWIDLDTAHLYLDRIRTLVDLRDDPAPGPSLTRDPDDDFVIYLARGNDVDVIVSGDGDLLEWEGKQLPIVTPAEFERMLVAGK
jgi:predicted nucleic acid-binding protein